MARKKESEKNAHGSAAEQKVMGLRPETREQPITETLETNFMPYAMSVIVSRAIPEIDGFKPSHRKLLYTMYKMGLLTGGRTKSANIVGQTMRLNPHGDAAIYETMVRLSQGYEALLTPFVDSKGNFGKVYSRDMAYAASRYTEAKLSAICAELFRDIDKDAVDMTDNYDGTMKEPTLLPTTFPNILVSSNLGIAVGMASNICGFNLTEVCETAIALLKDPGHDILSTLPGPDFSTGGNILAEPDALREIYRTGRGSIKVRARYRYLPKENIIEIFEIPYSTAVEVIIDKVAELVKAGKLKEISDMRDESDRTGLKLALDLKRGTDPDKLMQKLFRMTPLQDSFGCNFNILIDGYPRVCGVGEIFSEWTRWREGCIRRRVSFDLGKKRDKLHLLYGLKEILLDIDRAISIIRETELEDEVVPNLMAGFGIDEIQANYVAELRLRNINREYILNRLQECEQLEKDIADLEDILARPNRVKKIIISELQDVIKKYPSPRKSLLLYDYAEESVSEEDESDAYPVTLFLSREGYFKKITPLSLRMGGEQKYKENDGPFQQFDSSSNAEFLIFTDRQQVYKCRASDFPDTKASVLGTYLPTELKMDEGESARYMLLPGDYSGSVLFFFQNGKCARVPISAYATKTNRKRLTGAYSDVSPLIAVLPLTEERDIVLYSSDGRALVFNSSLLADKPTRGTQGVAVLSITGRRTAVRAEFLSESRIRNDRDYRARTLPKAGGLLKDVDRGEEQMNLLGDDA
ncbi:MAG: DNA topoisomerase (ATP-hydrolyzing) subunit A [Oscillospiraceae bacterium]|nr:DNA topoisomerase (ATP-hydrolyzing) subunit A [Oscillospiraceae bacterium]